MKDYEVNMAAMKDEISERENVIAQNYTTIQLLRKRLADLEKHKYVLGFRTQVTRLFWFLQLGPAWTAAPMLLEESHAG